MKKRTLAGGLAVLVVAALYLANASWLAPMPVAEPLLLSHRGLYQHYSRDGLTRDSCTAEKMLPPTHSFLENTLPSIGAAFELGADGVEIDVHPTADGDFVVFHDWTVDCRTDGTGTTRDLTMAELKALDIGYGYTADGGQTFPFRGHFKGQMPSLSEVLTAFPEGSFLINVKSNDAGEADLLDAWIRRHPEARSERLSVFAGQRPADRMRKLRPEMKVTSRSGLKQCATWYMAVGWSGYMPKACRGTTVYLPINYAPVAWGYPKRLQERFASAGSYVFIVGEIGTQDSGLPSLNTSDEFARVPKSWRMGIVTDSIDVIGPLAKPDG